MSVKSIPLCLQKWAGPVCDDRSPDVSSSEWEAWDYGKGAPRETYCFRKTSFYWNGMRCVVSRARFYSSQHEPHRVCNYCVHVFWRFKEPEMREFYDGRFEFFYCKPTQSLRMAAIRALESKKHRDLQWALLMKRDT